MKYFLLRINAIKGVHFTQKYGTLIQIFFAPSNSSIMTVLIVIVVCLGY